MSRLMRSRAAAHIDFFELSGIIEENPKAIPSDLDMIMERRGRFLVGEWKRQGEDFGHGQKIMLKSLAKVPCFRVLVIEGNTDVGMTITALYLLKPNGMLKKIGNSKDCLKRAIVEWHNQAR